MSYRTLAVCLVPFSLLAGPKNWTVPHQPFHIAGNVYYVGTAGLGSYLITTPAGDILLDGGVPESAPLIEKNVRALGFKMQDVKYLLNSHAHYDHCGGLAQLKRDSGAKMVASAPDTPILEAGKHGSYGADWSGKFPPVHVDRVIQNGERVELGGTVLTAVVTPGHTKGCTTWTMKTSEAGKTYNVVFYCSTSVPGYPLLHNREYPEIVNDYRHSFAVLRDLPADIFLSNHSEVFQMDEKLARVRPGNPNPFVDPGELRRYVHRSEADFDAVLAKQRSRPSLH